jgi:hypothetical protein
MVSSWWIRSGDWNDAAHACHSFAWLSAGDPDQTALRGDAQRAAVARSRAVERGRRRPTPRAAAPRRTAGRGPKSSSTDAGERGRLVSAAASAGDGPVPRARRRSRSPRCRAGRRTRSFSMAGPVNQGERGPRAAALGCERLPVNQSLVVSPRGGGRDWSRRPRRRRSSSGSGLRIAVSDVATASAHRPPNEATTLAISGRVASSLIAFLDGVNRWGGELVYD